jgi:hypothetical protein
MSGCVDAGDPPRPGMLGLPAGDLEGEPATHRGRDTASHAGADPIRRGLHSAHVREDVGLLKPDCFSALPIDRNQHPCPQSAPPQRLRLFPVATNQIAISRSTTWNSIPPIG